MVLDIMWSMSYLPGMGLGRRQHGPSEFMASLDHDVAFGLGFTPIEADYRYGAIAQGEGEGSLDSYALLLSCSPIHPKPSRLLREGIGATCTV